LVDAGAPVPSSSSESTVEPREPREQREQREEHTLRAPRQSYELTRFVCLRALGFIYAVAFLILCNQGLPPTIRSCERS
jgi:hypothetical protein